MLRLSCLILFVAVASAGVVKVNDCGHHEVREVRINLCTGDPCVIHKGKNLHLEVDFTANQDSKKADLEMTAKLGETDVDLPVPDDMCDDGGLKCPLKKGQNYTFKFDIYIPDIIPSVSTEVTAKLTGDNGLLACGKIKGEVRD